MKKKIAKKWIELIEASAALLVTVSSIFIMSKVTDENEKKDKKNNKKV